MKLRQVVLAIAAAGYVASASAGVMDWLLGRSEPQPQGRLTAPHVGTLDSKEQAERREKLRQQLNWRAGDQTNVIQANVHRAGVGNAVPFVREKGLTGEQTYIVQLADQPLALYQGGVSGYAAVAGKNGKAKIGSKLNLKTNAVKNYSSYLGKQQASALNRIRAQVKSNATPFHYYKNAFNGMALRLSQDQAEAVSKLPGVLSVTRSQLLKLNTDVGPTHIGAGEIWDGSAAGISGPTLGEGMIAGILDTGINSDHPSFAATGGDGYSHSNPYGSGVYKGDCAKPEFAALCNDKLIGIHSYPEVTNAYLDWDLVDPNTGQPKRPANGEDYHGHGSHTASTVAGNVMYNVPLSVPTLGETGDGYALPHTFARISGVAPHANIVAYQVCYYGNSGDKFAGCPETATLKAVDDAIADGVDVINYSIGGGERFPWESPTELAFLAAREAGISVAAAAGNAGPFYRDHSSPWLAAIAATTHGRAIELGTKKLQDFSGGDNPPGWALSGYSLSGGITAPVVAAANFDNPVSDQADELCEQPYPAGTFHGEIVVCKRGVNSRLSKGENVLAGGAGGLILYDDPDASWDTPTVYDIGHDPHVLPAIHLDSYSGDTVIAWLASGSGHTATITDVNLSVSYDADQADQVAEFSSRGPSETVNTLMFPSIGAPGVDIFAAYADEHPFSTNTSGDYTIMSGTSMATPHVTGALALVRKSHPDWTPAEVQSALMLTAAPATLPSYWGAPSPAGFFDAGSGVIRVNHAVDAGLVMDETASNFRAANPNEGGNAGNLNMPFFVNRACKTSCSWMRTFRATRDGSWTVETRDITAQGAPTLRLQATPSSFTLRAGETKTVFLEAVTDDVSVTGGYTNIDSSTEDRFGEMKLVPADSSPTLHLPVIVRWGSNGLPNEISADAHRTTGRNIAQPVDLPEFSQLTSRVYGLQKAAIRTAQLTSPQHYGEEGGEALANDSGRHIEWVDVPAGTKRLVVDVYPTSVVTKWGGQATAAVDLGRDMNDDNLVDWSQEAICYSVWLRRNFCAINNPEPGRYWIIVSNEKYVDTWGGEVDTVDPIQWSYAVIGSDDSHNLSVVGPSSSDGRAPVDLGVQWNIPTLAQGELYYGAFDVGTDAGNAGNLGIVGVRLEHVGPDVTLVPSKSAARVGDVVDYTVQLDPNLFGQDRNFKLDVTLPNGLKLMPGTARLVGNNGRNSLSSSEQSVSVSGNQEATVNTGRQYVFTTSDTDSSCRVPGSPDGKFWDLRMMGYSPLSVVGGQSQQAYISTSTLFWGEDVHVPMYGVKREHTQGLIGLSPGGFVQYDGMVGFFPIHYPLGEQFYPDIIVAPYWRGDTGVEPDYQRGVIVARDSGAGLQYFQWAGIGEIPTLWNGFEYDEDARYNYQAVISEKLDFEPGNYEVVFAYGDMNGDYNEGSVGTHGYYGPRGTFGPELGWMGDSFGYDNLSDKIRKGLVICGDYHGPEQSAITLKFAAKVGAGAVGSSLNVALASQYADAETITINKTLTVVGNIVVGGLSDVETMQNETVEDLTVMYVDNLPTANVVEVSGAHVTADVHGNTAGSTFDLIPEQDWAGETNVTITVYDAAQPNDRHSQTFKLTVNPVATAKVRGPSISVVAGASASLDASLSWGRTGTTLSYSWQQTGGSALSTGATDAATLAISSVPAGEYQFTVTVDDGISTDSASVTLKATSNGSSDGGGGGGGSVPLLAALGLVALAAARRRRH
ncbi:S8 family peptidase [Permianibacter sp. IMCC34836]|uniref:S8 family peptidase n=1 Tax=Permianibacter fluminis TaxID=2738515 RepID=UPI001552B677|nr:S8 family peptidase [Permianibacter fluminis]NQD35699.1 S8 family peptidase [Permianibacter fluminis]